MIIRRDVRACIAFLDMVLVLLDSSFKISSFTYVGCVTIFAWYLVDNPLEILSFADGLSHVRVSALAWWSAHKWFLHHMCHTLFQAPHWRLAHRVQQHVFACQLHEPLQGKQLKTAIVESSGPVRGSHCCRGLSLPQLAFACADQAQSRCTLREKEELRQLSV